MYVCMFKKLMLIGWPSHAGYASKPAVLSSVLGNDKPYAYHWDSLSSISFVRRSCMSFMYGVIIPHLHR